MRSWCIFKLEFAAAYGVDRYIVQISIGLENGEVVMEQVWEAPRAVERLEAQGAANVTASASPHAKI